jgi:hypothetical protein|tara:strand:+ start:1164 stop:1472 length:309 start_codon:yes stop_codon:yes gene_type:complete
MGNYLSSEEWLKKYLKKGDTIYTICKHVSRSGMMRHIAFYIMLNNEPFRINAHIADVLDMKFNKHNDALKVSGTGMDMGFHIVYSLSQTLFDDGYNLNQRWM